MKIDPNGTAFPLNYNNGNHLVMVDTGLTIRAELAARALQGLLSSWGQHDVTSMEELSSDAVRAADALIEQLNNKTT